MCHSEGYAFQALYFGKGYQRVLVLSRVSLKKYYSGIGHWEQNLRLKSRKR